MIDPRLMIQYVFSKKNLTKFYHLLFVFLICIFVIGQPDHFFVFVFEN